eukprot:scaffold144846_cov16-Tisochrysis_lutea.AAC.1
MDSVLCASMACAAPACLCKLDPAKPITQSVHLHLPSVRALETVLVVVQATRATLAQFFTEQQQQGAVAPWQTKALK